MSDASNLYIHIPFCMRKCGYCDFYSTENLGLKSGYINALVSEIELRSLPSAPVESIYFGGGTPSLLDTGEVERLLASVEKNFCLSPDTEITLEVNPGTIDKSGLTGLKQAGINRLSIGVQSFLDWKLARLTRIHTAGQAVSCYEQAVASGFENIGIDLIYAVPNETLEDWQYEMTRAVDLNPAHLSCYMLTVEKGTPFFIEKQARNHAFPGPDARSEKFVTTSAFLSQNGYDHYEISNFAIDRTRHSLHNKSCWQRRPYLGFGAGAHSFDGCRRSWNHLDAERYIRDIGSGRLPVAEQEILSTGQVLLEIIMLGLRTSEGIDIPAFDSISLQRFEHQFRHIVCLLQERQWCRMTKNSLALTIEGRARLNHILELFAAAI